MIFLHPLTDTLTLVAPIIVLLTTTFCTIYWMHFRNAQKAPSSPSMNSSAHTPQDSPRENGNILIIDGCNGPIRFDRDSSISGQAVTSNDDHNYNHEYPLSFLRVSNGVNRGERMQLLPKIQQALSTLPCFNRSVVYFDGLGMKRIENEQREITPWIRMEVTNRTEEVDDVIVDLVVERNARKEKVHGPNTSDNNMTTTLFDGLDESARLDDALMHLQNNSKDQDPQQQQQQQHHEREQPITRQHAPPDFSVYTVTRNEQGSGKARGLLKPLCMLRPSSVFCLFGSSFRAPLYEKSLGNVKELRSKRWLLSKVEVRRLEADHETFVVTDDIHLRERIVHAGGFVMTFEQLWTLLDSL